MAISVAGRSVVATPVRRSTWERKEARDSRPVSESCAASCRARWSSSAVSREIRPVARSRAIDAAPKPIASGVIAPWVTMGESSVPTTTTRPTTPTRPPRASTPLAAATSQSMLTRFTSPALKPTMHTTAMHESASSRASQRSFWTAHSTMPVTPITAKPIAAGTGWEVTAGSTASSPPPTTASRIRTRAA